VQGILLRIPGLPNDNEVGSTDFYKILGRVYNMAVIPEHSDKHSSCSNFPRPVCGADDRDSLANVPWGVGFRGVRLWEGAGLNYFEQFEILRIMKGRRGKWLLFRKKGCLTELTKD
jgi:hypothetical protein